MQQNYPERARGAERDPEETQSESEREQIELLQCEQIHQL